MVIDTDILFERNAVEQHFHILYRADRYAGFADVAHYARMVGIVAAVRSEVERHRQAFLARGEVTAVECVGFGGGREAGVLADRPRTHHVHRAVRAAQERCDTCRIVQVLHSLEVFGRVGALDGNLFGGYPGAGPAPQSLALQQLLAVVPSYVKSENFALIILFGIRCPAL